jgi:hypothetical protein
MRIIERNVDQYGRQTISTNKKHETRDRRLARELIKKLEALKKEVKGLS